MRGTQGLRGERNWESLFNGKELFGLMISFKNSGDGYVTLLM